MQQCLNLICQRAMNSYKLPMIASLALLMLLATSCKKESTISGTQLIGRWEQTEAYLVITPGGPQLSEPVVSGNRYEFKPLQRFKSTGIVGIVATTCEGMYSLSSDSTLRLRSNCFPGQRSLKLVEITSNYFVLQNPPSPLDPQVISRVKYTKR